MTSPSPTPSSVPVTPTVPPSVTSQLDSQVQGVETEVKADAAPLVKDAEADTVAVKQDVIDRLHADLKMAATWFSGNRQRYFEDLVDLLKPHVSNPSETAGTTPAPASTTVQTG